ncbi:hypothetical protein K0A82_24335, partial [Salmonella enterica subsp. enterica serovar Reading]|nr:hypothetical protein [Salmonella enterica subsp. enterica serovar Reading]
HTSLRRQTPARRWTDKQAPSPVGYPLRGSIHRRWQTGREVRTGGDIKVQYFPDGQLGGERELVELTQVGVVDITKVSSGLMES